jgi:hypothetical protein
VIGLLISLLAEWRFRIGWGNPVQWSFDHSERVQGLTSLGYAMRPVNVMMLLNLSAFLLFHAFLWTRADPRVGGSGETAPTDTPGAGRGHHAPRPRAKPTDPQAVNHGR